MKVKESSANAAVIFNEKDDLESQTKSVLSNTDSEGSLTLNEMVFEKRLLEPEGVVDMVPYYKLIKSQVQRTKPETSTSTLPLGVTYVDEKLGNELRLIDKIQVILPKQKVVWKLLKIFFKDMYPFMPFLDENSFRTEIEKILGPEGFADRKIEHINVEKRLDLAYIGTLLILLRLSFLSLFTNQNDIDESRLKMDNLNPEDQAYHYLLLNPITINIIVIAQECLDQFNLYRQPTFPVLSLALYTRLYHTYAPEDGDGADGGGSSGMLALLIKMAVSLGCNREPDNLPNMDRVSPMNNVTRRIWHCLILQDLNLAYTFGQPISISRGTYDARVPFYRKGEECLRDVELDKFITEALFGSAALYMSARNVVHLVLNVEGATKISEVCKAVSALELVMSTEYGSLDSCLNPKPGPYQDICRILAAKFYIAVKAFNIMIFFYLFLNYEKKNPELAFFYARKILLITVGEMMPHFFEMIGNFKNDLVLNPPFEQFIHKSNIILMALIIRVNFLTQEFKENPEHHSKLELNTAYNQYFKNLIQLSSALTRCLEVSIAVISKISNRYYYAWRITKGHSFLLRTITKNKFYQENREAGAALRLGQFSNSQIEGLTNICETTLGKLGKQNTDYVCNSDICVEFKKHYEQTKKQQETSRTSTPVPETPGFFSKIPKAPKTPTTNQNSILEESRSPPAMTPRFDLDFVNSVEIDKLWLQVLSGKDIDNPNGRNPDILNPEPKFEFPSGTSRGSNVNDFFGSISFDALFDI
ncbi:Citrinin biosynthesis cluster MFS transporter mrr1 [Yamadazyma tenuis]|nr:Citrinin biosynthesis cluster MFS transporter mrr1 [Yamadazyma tenuis]